VPTIDCAAARHAWVQPAFIFKVSTTYLEIHMPVIAWLLGVPLSIVILLMLFGVF